MAAWNKIVEWRAARLSFASVFWLFQRLSAVALLGLVAVHAHCIQRSFISSGAVAYGDLTALFSRPSVKIAEVCLFFFGALHFINGIRSVAAIFFRNSVLRGRVEAAAVIAGAAFFCTVSIAILSL